MTQAGCLPFLILLLLSASPWAFAQKGRSEVEEGNRRFQAGDYERARESYREALEQAPGSSVATFNLGGSEYKLDEFSGAEESFLQAIGSGNSELLAEAHYNLANSLFKQGRMEESIEGYKQALRLNPQDPAAKHNLEFALKQQQDEQEQQQNQNEDDSSEEDQDQEEQQDEDQDQQDQQGESPRQPDEEPSQDSQKQEGDESEEQDSDDRSQADEPEQQEQEQPAEREQAEEQDQTDVESESRPHPAQGQLTKEEASRLLEAIQEDLQSLRREQLKKLKRSRAEKDW